MQYKKSKNIDIGNIGGINMQSLNILNNSKLFSDKEFKKI